MIPTLFLISVISFILIELPPGDMASAYLARMERSRDQFSDETMRQVEAFRAQFGLDRPMHQRYLLWAGNFVTGNFGYSFVWHAPVRQLIGDRIGLTVLISLASLILSNLLIWPIAIRAAVHQYGWFDNTFSLLAFFAMAIPSFMMALVLMYLAYEYFDASPGGLFSPQYVSAPWSIARAGDLLAHLWIPIVILALGSIGGGVRSIRANLLDQLRMPYVTAARAKGVPERRLILKYPLRMAANPFVCSIGWLLPSLIGGEVIVSTVLGIPTTGPILLEGIMNQDMYVAGAIVMLLSALTVVGTLISDLLLALLDPRIRLQ